MAGSAAAGLSGRERAAAVRLVMLACLVDYMGVGMIRTLMPYYVLRLAPGSGWSNASLLGSLETAYGAGQMVGAVVMGRLSDLQGRRTVLLLSFAGASCGYSLAAVATTPALLLLSRAPVGLAKQTVTVSRAIVADCCGAGHERSASFARMIAAIGVGYSIGPLAGSRSHGP
jgi:MFS family permease